MASALLASRAEPLWGERKVYARKNLNPNPNSNPNSNSKSSLNLNPNSNSFKQLNHGRHMEELESVSPAVSDDSSAFNRNSSRHPKEITHGGYVTFNIALYTKRELKDLKRRLLLELDEVQRIRSRIESANFQSGSGYLGSQREIVEISPEDGFRGKPMPKGKHHKKSFGNKRSFPFDSSRDPKRAALEAPVSGMMAQCGKIVQKLMDHKHGWIFKEPVDVVKLNLHDYHQIIKHPMDFGTVKSKLQQNLYETPMEFASDIRLTLNNALTYNPKGHDVYIMALKLQEIFEKSFATAYKKFQNEQRRVFALTSQDRQRNVAMPAEEMRWEREAPVPAEERRSVLSSTQPPTPEPARRPDTMSSPMPVSSPAAPVSRQHQPIPAIQSVKTLPKPKARESNKRDMTFDEKHKLSKSLESLPQDKMDQAVQIMKKKNAALSQNDDEIEVDIEVLDIETLWELDRFVSNHRKTMSKVKRPEDVEPTFLEENKSPPSVMTEAVTSEKIKKVEPVEEDIDIGEDMPTNNFPPVEIEKDAGYASGSSSSSSSSSGSSSSSDSGSSSDSDSDAESPQKEPGPSSPNGG